MSSLLALEHDDHDRALRSVGATYVLVFTSELEIPFSLCPCIVGISVSIGVGMGSSRRANGICGGWVDGRELDGFGMYMIHE